MSSPWLKAASLAALTGIGLAYVIHLTWDAAARLFTLLHMVQLN